MAQADPLAVGTADRDDRKIRYEAESIAYFGNPIEPQLNGLWVDAALIAKPIGKGLGRHPAMRQRWWESVWESGSLP